MSKLPKVSIEYKDFPEKGGVFLLVNLDGNSKDVLMMLVKTFEEDAKKGGKLRELMLEGMRLATDFDATGFKLETQAHDYNKIVN